MTTAAHDPKLAAAAGAVTTFTGIDLSWLELLPPWISLTASIIGAATCFVLLRNHLAAGKYTKERHELKMKILRRRLQP